MAKSKITSNGDIQLTMSRGEAIDLRRLLGALTSGVCKSLLLNGDLFHVWDALSKTVDIDIDFEDHDRRVNLLQRVVGD